MTSIPIPISVAPFRISGHPGGKTNPLRVLRCGLLRPCSMLATGPRGRPDRRSRFGYPLAVWPNTIRSAGPERGKPCRAQARQPDAVSRHVSLVRVAEVSRDPRQIALAGRHGSGLRNQAAEAQHSVEGLGPVSDGVVKATPELTL